MDTLNHQFYTVKGKVMHKLGISKISWREQQTQGPGQEKQLQLH